GSKSPSDARFHRAPHERLLSVSVRARVRNGTRLVRSIFRSGREGQRERGGATLLRHAAAHLPRRLGGHHRPAHPRAARGARGPRRRRALRRGPQGPRRPPRGAARRRRRHPVSPRRRRPRGGRLGRGRAHAHHRRHHPAHRGAEGWVYGPPELAPGQREAIAAARRVANPGCWPTGFLLLVRPLLDAGVIARDAPLTVHGLSGYSGGGKPLIEKWEDPARGLRSLVYEAPYSLAARHKHIPEMVRWSGLEREPMFVPAVGPFRCGMRIEIPLPAALLRPGADG